MTGVGTAHVASGQGFGPKVQLGGTMELSMAIPLAGWISLVTTFALFDVLPSDTQGGFVYRGYAGGSLALAIEAWGAVVDSEDAGTVSVGGSAGAAAALPGYQNTTLYFFYPEARLDGLILWRPPRNRNLELRIVVPLRAQFRRDMSYSFSAGIGIGAAYKLGAAK